MTNSPSWRSPPTRTRRSTTTPCRSVGPIRAAALLPEWYMPAVGPVRRTKPRMIAVVAIIASLVVVNGAGLCVTYGIPEIAW
jgi:hypothetical protein